MELDQTQPLGAPPPPATATPSDPQPSTQTQTQSNNVPNVADASSLPGSIPIDGRCPPTQVLFSVGGSDRCIGPGDLVQLKDKVASVKKER